MTRSQKTEDRRQKTEDRSQKSEVSSQKSEVRSLDKITYFPLTGGLIRQCRKACQKLDVFCLQ